MQFENDSTLTFAGFNQDRSRLAVATASSFHLYRLNPFEIVYSTHSEGATCLEMLYNTNLVAQVGTGDDPRSTQKCLRLINTKRDREIIRMNYKTPVKAVRMNRQRLVLLLEDTIYIYDVTNLKVLHVINSTPRNPHGVCALATCSMYTPAMEHSSAAEEPPVFHYLAYPSKPGSGEVNVYDVIAMRIVTTISAHQTELACLEFSNRGDRLATASVKGTVFRVFDSTNGDKLFELRRGYSTTALIRHMTFSEDANWLCVSSNKSTVHVFKLFQAEAPPAEASWSSYLSSTLQYAAGYLPTTVTEVWTQERSFAQAMLPEDVGEHIATMGGTPESPTIMVVSHDGWLFQYNINVIEGGECGTPRKHRVDGSDAKPAEDAAAHKPSTP